MTKQMMKWRSPLWLTIVSVSVFGAVRQVYAHGVAMSYQVTEAVEVQGLYDSGEPMTEAQVAVYAPNDPSAPWLTGTTNAQGLFLFKPDLSQPGNWEVQFRQAGHGDVLIIPVEGDVLTQSTATRGGTGGLTLAQKLIVFGAMTWGFVGTALYFSGRRQRPQQSTDSDLQSTTSQS